MATARPAGEHGCVLVVDTDGSLADTLAMPIRSLRLTIASAPDGRQAIATAHHTRVRLILVELDLPDIPGLDVVRALRADGVDAPFIVISSRATVPIAVEAMALGALNVIEKPCRPDVLCAEVACAIGSTSLHREAPPRIAERAANGTNGTHGMHTELPSPAAAEPGTPSERWRDFVMALILAEQDLKTNGMWARHLGVSLSVLREACRLVHIAPHDARDFARMLRAIWRSNHEWKPETLLNFADARTLTKLETRSGFRGRHQTTVPTLEEFFERQQWIPADNPALLTVRRALMGHGR